MNNQRYKDGDGLIKMYNTFGEDLICYNGTIREKTNNHIKEMIDLIDNDVTSSVWIFILNDVLHKRRFNKIDKLINNIK